MTPILSCYRDVDIYQNVIRIDYQLPDGTQGCREVKVRQEDMVNENRIEGQASLLLERAKEQLKHAVADDIRKWVERNIQEGDRNMVAPQYTMNGTAAAAYYPLCYTGTGDNYYLSTDNITVANTQWTQVLQQTPQFHCIPTPNEIINQPKQLVVRFKLGKHTLSVVKTLGEDGALDITQEDIDRAKDTYFKEKRIQIITHKAERKAEDLLSMFISEVDFRSYKQNGFITVKSGNRAFRIYKDAHKHIDMFEKDENRGVFVPKNRLCVHTERRSLPPADEVLGKLMLVRSNRVLENANVYGADGLEKELVLV